MNNLISIMALDEETAQRAVFVKAREEGGINSIYDPALERFLYQVFIHKQFPYATSCEWQFEDFNTARKFALEKFADWEFLQWDGAIKRPCAEGGTECGSGSCETCKTGGGCGEKGGCGTG